MIAQGKQTLSKLHCTVSSVGCILPPQVPPELSLLYCQLYSGFPDEDKK